MNSKTVIYGEEEKLKKSCCSQQEFKKIGGFEAEGNSSENECEKKSIRDSAKARNNWEYFSR